MDSHERRLKQLESRERQRKAVEKSLKLASSPFVEWAMKNPGTWVRFFTKTYNEHWQIEGRLTPEEPFPPYDYFEYAFQCMDRDRIWWWEKSRDMMLSWCCVAYLEFHAMKTPRCGILFQTQKDKKVIQLVDYAKHLWRTSDPRIREAFPLAKPLERQPVRELHFANGSSIIGIPGGADQIRSYHPWGYLNDESSFQPEAGECFNEALAAVKGKIIFNSSAGPGWYADVRRGIIRGEEN